jgi:hypothetical protein
VNSHALEVTETPAEVGSAVGFVLEVPALCYVVTREKYSGTYSGTLESLPEP